MSQELTTRQYTESKVKHRLDNSRRIRRTLFGLGLLANIYIGSRDNSPVFATDIELLSVSFGGAMTAVGEKSVAKRSCFKAIGRYARAVSDETGLPLTNGTGVIVLQSDGKSFKPTYYPDEKTDDHQGLYKITSELRSFNMAMGGAAFIRTDVSYGFHPIDMATGGIMFALGVGTYLYSERDTQRLEAAYMQRIANIANGISGISDDALN